MQIHLPDPQYTASARARFNFYLAFKISLACIAILWLIYLLDWFLDLKLYRLGLRPRELSGLGGILFAPLVHGGFGHLLSNTLPLLVLGTGLLYLYPNSALRVLPVLYLGSGLLVWLLARPALHIGASGLVYGLVVYLFVAGLARRDLRAVAAAMLVYFLYGTIIWGILPIRAGVSWETHLAAAVLGLLLAIHYRYLDLAPRKHYEWEDEEAGDDHNR